jgi:hypothetical protein
MNVVIACINTTFLICGINMKWKSSSLLSGEATPAGEAQFSYCANVQPFSVWNFSGKVLNCWQTDLPTLNIAIRNTPFLKRVELNPGYFIENQVLKCCVVAQTEFSFILCKYLNVFKHKMKQVFQIRMQVPSTIFTILFIIKAILHLILLHILWNGC